MKVPKKLIKGAIYHIWWHDTLAVDAWTDEQGLIEKAQQCSSNQETIGFYVCTDSDYHIFSSTINRVVSMLPYANSTFIPIGCIKKIKKI